ncbi:MAG TPA: ABC transporter ATP-binding protein, partial [Candidatus Acidoferrales bacterium]|nr:ABC transporter ATP-binding protein [Candidatus Acidoferrales bacterium]
MRMAGGFGGMGSQRGMSSRAERGHTTRQSRENAPDAGQKKKLNVMDQLPAIWALMRPRRGLLGLGLVLMAINRVSGLALPFTTKYLVDNVMIHHQTRLLMPLVGGVLLATILQGVTSYTLTQTLSKAAQRMITELRRKVQEHVGRLPVAYYDANKTGALVSRIMSDVEGVRNLIGTGLVEFLGGLLTAAIALFMLLRISPVMTGLAAGLLLVSMFGLRKAFSVLRPIFRERAKISAEVSGRLTESLSGVRVVKGYHAEEREADVFTQGVQRLLDNVIKSLTTMSMMSFSTTALGGVVGALVMLVGSHQVLQGRITVGQFMSYTAFLAFMIAPVFQVVGIGTQLTEAVAGLERTREVLDERPEDEDPRRTVTLPDIVGELAFDDVSFAYEPGKTVLQDVSFLSQPGTVTALVGSSGSGKSTIIGLVAAFHVPLSGQVLVDGVDLATVKLDSYRTRLGVVLQESFLFDGTIRENVAFSRPYATEEEILAACRIARVDEFAERFPETYDTIIGERGVKLSGGQRQRVSIARAILADPRILILDEATSSLDSESESYIQQGLAYLMQGRTTFVIAHRLSTIQRADEILVVQDGRIIERGTHEALLSAKGRYSELCMKQQGMERNLLIRNGADETAALPSVVCAPTQTETEVIEDALFTR